MFLGHHAVAFAAKRMSPNVSLGTLVLSAQFIDLLWPVLLLLGFEHVRFAPGTTAVSPFDFYDYPITHSLLMVLVWAGGLGALYYAVRRSARGALVIGACVLSHWVLDFLPSPRPAIDSREHPHGGSWSVEQLRGDDPCGRGNVRGWSDVVCEVNSGC